MLHVKFSYLLHLWGIERCTAVNRELTITLDVYRGQYKGSDTEEEARQRYYEQRTTRIYY